MSDVIKKGQVEKKIVGGELVLKIEKAGNAARVVGKEKYVFEVQSPQFTEAGAESTKLIGYKEGMEDPETGYLSTKNIVIKFQNKNPVSKHIC